MLILDIGNEKTSMKRKTPPKSGPLDTFIKKCEKNDKDLKENKTFPNIEDVPILVSKKTKLNKDNKKKDNNSNNDIKIKKFLISKKDLNLSPIISLDEEKKLIKRNDSYNKSLNSQETIAGSIISTQKSEVQRNIKINRAQYHARLDEKLDISNTKLFEWMFGLLYNKLKSKYDSIKISRMLKISMMQFFRGNPDSLWTNIYNPIFSMEVEIFYILIINS